MAAGDGAHRRGAAVLFVVGVQNQQQVQGIDHDRVGLVIPGRNREHHAQEIRAIGKLILRVDKWLAYRFLV